MGYDWRPNKFCLQEQCSGAILLLGSPCWLIRAQQGEEVETCIRHRVQGALPGAGRGDF